MTVEFLFAVYFLQLTQYFSIVLYNIFERIFVYSLNSLYSLNTAFTEIKSSWLISESIKALKIRSSTVFKLCFS